MTEVERIIKKGIVTDSFLKEEVKNDFFITTERKKIWTVILDLLYEFDKVCKKYSFKYFLDGGSLIGAVRHHGFIPWDDDFDVCMPRKDFEKFIQLGSEFSHPLFLQTPYTDPESFYSYAKLRNSNTTGVSYMFQYQNFNHGIWLTIFPLDVWEMNTEDIVNEITYLNRENSTYMRMKNPHLDAKNIERVKNYSGRNPLETYEEIHRLASQFRNKSTQYVSAAAACVLPYSKKIWYAEDFSSQLYVNFENRKVPIPIGYDRVLKTVFGNYMDLPPLEERGLHHDDGYLNADIPYKDYIATLDK